MFKSLTKIALLSGVAIVGTSSIMGTASAEPKFVFRYTPGSINTTSNENGGCSGEPEIPEVEEVDDENQVQKLVIIGNGNFSYRDTNATTAIDRDDEIITTFTIRNDGDEIVRNVSAQAAVEVLHPNHQYAPNFAAQSYSSGYNIPVNCQTPIAPGATSTCTFNGIVKDEYFSKITNQGFPRDLYRMRTALQISNRNSDNVTALSNEMQLGIPLISLLNDDIYVPNTLALNEQLIGTFEIDFAKENLLTSQNQSNGSRLIIIPHTKNGSADTVIYNIQAPCTQNSKITNSSATCSFNYTLSNLNLNNIFKNKSTEDLYFHVNANNGRRLKTVGPFSVTDKR